MSTPVQNLRCSDCGKLTEMPYSHTWRVSIDGQDQGEVHFHLCLECRDKWTFGSTNSGGAESGGRSVVIESVPQTPPEAPSGGQASQET
jgi:hypothetical protein